MNPRSCRSLTLFAGVAAICCLPFLLPYHETATPSAIEAAQPASELRPNRAAADELHRSELAPESTFGWYGAPVGSCLTFAVDCGFGSEVIRRTGGDRADGGHFVLRGRLEVTIVDRRDDEALLAIRMPDAELGSPHDSEGAAATLAAAEAAFTRTTLARIDATGAVLGLRFVDGLGYFERSQLRALLANFRFVVPVDTSAAWTVRDADDTGVFVAEYAWQAGDPDAATRPCSRRRTQYLSVTGAHGGGECAVELQSHATATLSHDVGWLVAANVDESTTLSLEGLDFDVRTTFTGTLALTHAERVSLGDMAEYSWDGEWAAAVSDPAEAAAIAAAHSQDRWRQKLAGVSIENLVDWFANLVATGQHEGEEYAKTWEEIAKLIELDPRALEQLVAWIQTGRFDELATSGLLTAIGAAETSAAQAALIEIQANQNLSDATRVAAVVGLVQSQRPTGDTLAAMFQNVTGPHASDDIGKVSLLVLGALAARGEAMLQSGESAFEHLLGLEAASRAHQTTAEWLTALGNSGLPQIVERIASYIHDDDVRVRESAVMALRQTTTDSAHDLLVRACDDASPIVRSRAAESLAEHGTARARAALRELIGRDTDAEVRRTALLGLSQQMDAETRALLRRIAQSDPTEQIRRLANELLQA